MRGVAIVLLLLSLARAAVLNVQRDVNLGFPYGQQKVRGVSLGGWLVLEPFITPSLFQATNNDSIVDEWTFSEGQSSDTAQAALKQHWDTWITEDDVKQIAAAGLNHIRIPIGFWAFDVSQGEPYTQGQVEYLDMALEWARNAGVKVWIDLHGAPGSENGQDNSGHLGEINWATDPKNVARTVQIIGQMAAKYGDPSYYGVVVGLSMLNEPKTYQGEAVLNTTRQYWLDAYNAARYPFGSQEKSGLALIISDMFQDLSTLKGFMTAPQYEDVLTDTHVYQTFLPERDMLDWGGHLGEACAYGEWTLSTATMWTVVGEWSLVSTDCAQWLNGRGTGSAYDGTMEGSKRIGDCAGKSGNSSTFSNDYKMFMRMFYDAQVSSMEQYGQGWIHWTWKTETSDDWSYKAGLAGGWIPRDPTIRVWNCSDPVPDWDQAGQQFPALANAAASAMAASPTATGSPIAHPSSSAPPRNAAKSSATHAFSASLVLLCSAFIIGSYFN